MRVMDDHSMLGRAAHIVPVEAVRSGFVVDVDPLALGHCVVDLGGGRRQPTDKIDPVVGIVLRHTLGDKVRVGDVLAFVHASSDQAAGEAVQAVLDAIAIGDERVKRRPLVKQRLA